MKTFHARSLLGGALLGQKRFDEAKPLLLSGYEGMKQRIARITTEDANRLAAALDRLIRLADETGKGDEARAWREEKARIEAQFKLPAPTDVASPAPVAKPDQPPPTPTTEPAGGKP